MTAKTTLRKEQDVQAAREVAPIANWVKPSRSQISLPTDFKPTFERIYELEHQLQAERAEKEALQKQLSSTIRRMDQLKDRLASRGQA